MARTVVGPVLAYVLATLTVLSALFSDARLAVARADDATDCVKGSGDTAIRACSLIINSKRLFGEPISIEILAATYYNRGEVYSGKGLYDRAIADFDMAIGLNPRLVSAYVNRGVALHAKGDYERAIADYSKAIKLNPNDAEAHSNRGASFEEIGQRDKAIADFRKAIDLRPGDRVGTDGLKRLGVRP